MAADVFVSYARKDREQILPWVRQLRGAGVSLWLDERDIDAAHLWTEEIIEAIRGSRVLLLMLSAASAASEQVLREVPLALEEHKRILPLLLEPVEIPATLPYPLAGLQQVELFHGEPEPKRSALPRALTRLGVATPGWQMIAPSSTASSAEPGASSGRAAPPQPAPLNSPASSAGSSRSTR